MKSDIKIGDFALCQKQELGVVLWEHVCKNQRTNRKYILYSGLNLTPGPKFGLNWQSKNPKKVTKAQMRNMLKGGFISKEDFKRL